MSAPRAAVTSSAGRARFGDLGARLGSGLALSGLGIVAVLMGGLTLKLTIVLLTGGLVWELARLCGAQTPGLLAGAAALSCLLVLLLPDGYGVPFLFLPAFAGATRVPDLKAVFAIFAVLILLAGYGVAHMRDAFGASWMVWLALVVIACDIAGYFAGRLLGGPKFWPRVSPKKTWSGTVAGWVAAGLVGAGAAWALGASGAVVALSVALAMAAQLGDVAESALKRKVGAKDSSSLLPGHGGLLDRFDGLLGAVVLFLMIEQAVGFPPLAVAG